MLEVIRESGKKDGIENKGKENYNNICTYRREGKHYIGWEMYTKVTKLEYPGQLICLSIKEVRRK